MKVSDFVAKRLAEHGVRTVFMITGGGAMHLNISIGREKKLRCVYNHHEQAGAMAAESYARLTGRLPAVCVTSGPGGINALNGVLGAWLDSIPMLVVSGQVRYENTVRATGLPLRQFGDQEFDIVRTVPAMTKYAVMVTKPEDIGYHLDRAIYLALHGRPGPAWIDVPLDVQGARIDEKKLRRYDPREDKSQFVPAVKPAKIRAVLQKLKASKRPVILAGTGIRIAGAQKDFLGLIERLGVPVLTAWNAHDLVPTAHSLCMGRPATIGDRAGNFILQNADLILAIGCRMNLRQIGYSWDTFARAAYKIIVDVDPVELQKPSIKPDLPVTADAGDFVRALRSAAKSPLPADKNWLDYCLCLKRAYPAVKPEYWKKPKPVNPYCFMQALSDRLKKNDIVVCGNGTACVAAFQAVAVKPGMRMYANSGCASMGYDLPAAIGAAVAAGKPVVCLAGDGSIQMNLQELQTILHNRLPVKIFWLNNSGYHSIRQTQRAFFGRADVGCDARSGVSFPDARKIARAYGIPFACCAAHAGLGAAIDAALSAKGPFLCEIVLDPEQGFEPRSASRALPDGRIVSPPFEDMYPFLPRGEFRADMLIEPVEEK
ncbi:MAG: thiamine pyrophosphate-binding protein [Elusimicrobiales bacterium]|nr:thiamine pyrophosphate-binding protein [Elusimicrobiales bacterium]